MLNVPLVITLQFSILNTNYLKRKKSKIQLEVVFKLYNNPIPCALCGYFTARSVYLLLNYLWLSLLSVVCILFVNLNNICKHLNIAPFSPLLFNILKGILLCLTGKKASEIKELLLRLVLQKVSEKRLLLWLKTDLYRP